MPLEIRELYIKVGIRDDSQDQHSEIVQDSQGNIQIEDMIQLCVEKVLEILKERNER
jgi:hypothetical protein